MSEIDQSLRVQVEQLEGLYKQGHLSEANLRAALVGLGLNPDLSLARTKDSDEHQKAVAMNRQLAEQASHTNYHVHIQKAYGLAIGDRSQASIASSDEHATPDDASSLAQYLHHVIEVNRRLQLQGIPLAGRLVSIDIEDIYITLTATERQTMTDEEAEASPWQGSALDEVAKVEPVGQDLLQEVAIRTKVKVQEALAAHPRLVVLGDPGSGKTTLLRYLARTYARDLCGERGLVAQRLGLLEQRLPILLPLRDFASYLQTHYPDPSTDGPRLLLDYLHTYFAHQDIALPEHFFADRLKGAKCVVLFDGLDEVAELVARRRVTRIVERFTITYPDNRYVITSRIAGYMGSAQLAADYFVTTVQDFSQADIQRFIAYWDRAVEVALAGGETPHALAQAQHQTELLLRSIQGNERIRDLAVNPLMLTVIALVQRYCTRLPERRTDLYEEAINVLLCTWDEAKDLNVDTALPGRQLDAGDRRGLLEMVALWMMEQRVHEIDADELREQLEGRFAQMGHPKDQAHNTATEFLQLINERSGLLTEREKGTYAFSHLTFQEYLAARAVADRPDYISYSLARAADSWWREVILMEVGYLSTQGRHRTTALIRSIIDCRQEPEPYYNLLLAAEASRDVGPARLEGDLLNDVRRMIRQDVDRGPSLFAMRFVGWLRERSTLSTMYNNVKPTLSSIRLYSAFLRLTARGSSRRKMAAKALARVAGAYWSEPYGEPEWVTIPDGDFWMGSNIERNTCQPLHRLHLAKFWMARVPITNAQYRLFILESGHRAPENWEDGRPPKDLENHPVTNVTWHDAVAYCQWLSTVTKKRVVLPSEAQWEKAARGHVDQRRYPWGDQWKTGYCNTIELGQANTTPVGIFPENSSPDGCLDMVGNVWEWTVSVWGKDLNAPDFKYPYNADDGRESMQAEEQLNRVMRGGSFRHFRYLASCTHRRARFPGYSRPYCGFRVARLS